MTQGWEEIDHTADWALRVWADNLPVLFETAARGMISLIGGETGNAQVQPFKFDISLAAPDIETLLVDWLTELLRLVEEESAVFDQISVNTIEEFQLRAAITGSQGSHFSKHIKAVTYHNLSIRHTSSGFETTIVFDV